jgi:ubiquinone/menaquinone biosynthesis C-methylase UbiE
MSARAHDPVKGDVLRMYMRYPYPSYTAEERRQIFPAELARYRFLGLEPFMRGARVVDVGCGTAHRVMPLAQHFGAAEYVGIDHSIASLDVARALARELGFAAVTLLEADLFELPFEDAAFDIVISQGVLHHTSDPQGGFRELVRVCKPGGFVNVYLYNKYNHWRHNLQKARVSRAGGDDLERRFRAAHRLYGKQPLESMTPAQVAGFYDQYCHPHKSDHTVGETLAWFDAAGLDYWGSYPPLGGRDFVAMAQYRAELMSRYPHFHNRSTRLIVRTAAHLPAMRVRPPPFARPGLMHRFLWQALYALQGSGGRYSGGPALCGRKRPWADPP